MSILDVCLGKVTSSLFFLSHIHTHAHLSAGFVFVPWCALFFGAGNIFSLPIQYIYTHTSLFSWVALCY